MKIPPDVYKQIKHIASQLPEIPMLDKNGKKVYKPTGVQSVLGKDIPEGVRVTGPVQPNKKYNIRTFEQQLLNHEAQLIQAYQLDGLQGMESYKVWCEQTDAEIKRLRTERERKEAQA